MLRPLPRSPGLSLTSSLGSLKHFSQQPLIQAPSMSGASGVPDNKGRPPRVPLNNGQGRRPGHRHPPCLLPPDREWGGPRVLWGLTSGARRQTAGEKRQWGERERSRSRFSSSAWERGSVAGGCFLSFEETGSRSALTSPPLSRNDSQGVNTPECAAGPDWLQRRDCWSWGARAPVQMPPPVWIGAMGSASCSRVYLLFSGPSLSQVFAGRIRTRHRKIQSYSCGLDWEESGLGLETVV